MAKSQNDHRTIELKSQDSWLNPKTFLKLVSSFFASSRRAPFIRACALLLIIASGCGFKEGAASKAPLIVMRDLSREDTPHLAFSETGRLDFTAQDAHGVLIQGWEDARGQVGQVYGSDANGIWSMALESTLIVSIMEPRDLVMHLVMAPHFDDSLPAQEVRILWNDMMVGTCSFKKEEKSKTVEFDVPVPVKAIRTGKNIITFVSKYATSEKELGRGTGLRREAFLLYCLSLAEPNQKTERYSPGTHGLYPKPVPVRFDNGAIAQWGTSALKFPMKIDICRRALLRFANSEDPQNRQKQVALVYDTLTGPVRFNLVPFGTLPAQATLVEADLSYYSGKDVEILFETRKIPESQPVRWSHPEILLEPAKHELHEPPLASTNATLPSQPVVSNVVFIVLDAWRSDRLQITGTKRQTAPFLDDLSAESIVFEHAYAAAPYTYSSTASLLSGLHLFQNKAVGNNMDGHSAIAQFARLPDVLKTAGIRTACISANKNVSLESGLAEGFDDFVDATEDPIRIQEGGSPELVTNQVRTYLERHKEERFFLYAHYRQPHEPYNAPAEFADTLSHDVMKSFANTAAELAGVNDGTRAITRDELLHLEARYDENIRAADAEVRKVFEILKANNLDRNTAVIITSDHGEAFKEHGFLSHNLTVYDEMIRIPYLLKLPGNPGGLFIHNAVAQTVDTFPTVCALLGIEAPPNLAGRNLLSEPPPANYGVKATSMSHPSYGWQAFYFDRYKLILNPMKDPVEVYDLSRDSKELENLANIEPVLADSLKARALTWKRAMSPHVTDLGTSQPPKRAISEETKEKLEALGYL